MRRRGRWLERVERRDRGPREIVSRRSAPPDEDSLQLVIFWPNPCPRCGNRGPHVYKTLPWPTREDPSEIRRYHRCHTCFHKWMSVEFVPQAGNQ